MELLDYVIMGALFLVIFIYSTWVVGSFWAAVGIWTVIIVGTTFFLSKYFKMFAQ